MKKLLPLILTAAGFLSGPVHAFGFNHFSGPDAAPASSLQWRTTTCELWQDGMVIGIAPCKAGFASDTAVRAIYHNQDSNGNWHYHQVGNPGVRLGGSNARECIRIRFTDGSQTVCTTQSPEQLRIKGD